MDFNQTLQAIRETILIIIASMGGGGIIILGLSSWIGKMWAERSQARIEAQYERELEDLKNKYAGELEYLKDEIAQHRDLLNSSADALSGGYARSHEHILDAMQILWIKTVELRKYGLQFWGMYDLLTDSEIEAFDGAEFAKFIPKKSLSEFTQEYTKFLEGTEEKRLFVSERLWKLFTIYKSTSLRMALKVLREIELGRIYSWKKDWNGKEDGVLLDILRTELGNDNFSTLIGIPGGNISAILSALENKMIEEMNESIFGKKLITMTIEEQRRLNDLLKISNPSHNP